MDRGSIIGRYPEASFLVLTVGLSVLVLLLPAPDEGTLLGLLLLATTLPTVIAIALTWLLDGRAGAARFIRQSFGFRSPLRWYVLAVIVGFVIQFGSSLVALGAGAIPGLQLRSPAPAIVVFALFALLEEIGWRGFALRRLLLRSSPLVAALIVGLCWGGVHFALAALVLQDRSPIAAALFPVTFSFPLAWVFVKSGGSVIVVTVLHFAANAFGSVAGPAFAMSEGDAAWYLVASTLVVAAVLVLGDRRWWFGRPGQTPVMATAS